MIVTDFDFLIRLNDNKPTEPPPALISEYVHGLRVIPAGDSKSGVLDVFYTPHLIEPMDCMGPYSGVNIVSFMKSVQSGVTFNCAENVSAYYIGANPRQQLYVTATLSLLEKWATTRLEPLMISCGLRDLLSLTDDDNPNSKSRRTPDKMYSKQYPGGSLSMTSLESPAGLRSESKQIVIIDEIDGAKERLSTGEGSSVEVVHGRAAAFGSRGKFMEFSTPTTVERSIIYKRFLMGDQRKYMVACPNQGCGVFQALEFKNLQPEYDSYGFLESVWYQCPECEGKINNWDKTEMLKNGYWEPTAKPESRTHRSYHINALYNPIGMMDWKAIYQKFLSAQENPSVFMQPFINNYLGLPFKEEGHRPDEKKVSKYRGQYKKGTVPDNVKFLTMAGDVQLGKEKYQKMSPAELDRVTEKLLNDRGAEAVWKREKLPRIEFEVMGVGKDLKTWMIDYQVVYGHTTLGPHEGAFKRLREIIESGHISYQKKNGSKHGPVMVFLDASEGKTRQTVFDFCNGWPKVYPIVNYAELKLKKDKKIDEASPFDIDRYRMKNKSREGGAYYQLSVNHYKSRLYRNLNTPRQQGENQAPTFCDFPIDTLGHYFKMLVAEEMLEDGGFYNSGVAAEALDCRAYNLAVEEIFLDIKVEEAKKRAKEQKYAQSEIDKIGKKWVLNQYGN